MVFRSMECRWALVIARRAAGCKRVDDPNGEWLRANMTEAELAELLRHCPTLYHMAERGSWPSIQRHGLLSTQALLDLFEIDGRQRELVLRAERPNGVPLLHARHGTAIVRDQKPMGDALLNGCLHGMTIPEWRQLLNGKVFFWLDDKRLMDLLNGKEYRDREHEVIEVASGELIQAYKERITFSPLNSGAPYPGNPVVRGSNTFQTISAYDYASRRRTRRPSKCVVELTIGYAVPDIERFVRQVRVWCGGHVVGVCYQR